MVLWSLQLTRRRSVDTAFVCCGVAMMLNGKYRLCYAWAMEQGPIPEDKAPDAFNEDIVASRRTPRFFSVNAAPRAAAEDIVQSVKDFVDHHDIVSVEQLDGLLEQLDTAIAITNDPAARALRKRLDETYRREMMA